MELTQPRSIPTSSDKPKVLVIGAGIAGLTVAHELQRTGKFEIEVIEKRPKAGGKARTEWAEHTFREHSMRILPGSYVCMHQVLEEIETPHGRAIDRLRPVTILFEHHTERGTEHTEVRGDYSTRGGFFKYVRDALRLLWFLKRAGVSLRDLTVFLYKVFSVLWTPERKVISEISRLSFSHYVSGNRVSGGFERVIFRIAEILVAAKSYASAGVVTRTLLEWFVTPLLRGKYVRRQVSEFDSSTSGALIDPWANWLEQQGVKFRFGVSVTEIKAHAGRIVEVKTRCGDSSEEVKADAYILAVQHNVADALLDDSLMRYIPDLFEFPRLGEEWAHSVQFHIKNLPDRLRELGSRSVAVVDSPWSIGYKIYSNETFRADDWQAGELGESEAVLTATISNSKRSGVVHHLPMLRCTREQILEEVLTQTRLGDVLSIDSGELGLDLDVRRGDDIDENSPEFAGHAITAIGTPDNRVFVSDSLMYIRLPGNLDIEPHNATGIFNLFLAGEYTRTNYRIPTMEKSCESGKRCAQEILKGFGVPRDEQRIPDCDLPFRILRSELFHKVVRVGARLLVVAAIAWLLFKTL